LRSDPELAGELLQEGETEMMVLENFEFRTQRREREKREKEERERQEAELARQHAEYCEQAERLAQISKPKSKTISEEYGIEDYTP
jgi:hypothetical protein